MERARRATSAREVAALVRDHRLPEEAIPRVWLEQQAVWESLLEDLALPQLIDRLPALTRIGLVKPFSAHAAAIGSRISDRDSLRRARIAPLSILAALARYRATRSPVAELLNALDAAFYASFESIGVSGKRMLIAVDVSSSMACGRLAGLRGLT